MSKEERLAKDITHALGGSQNISNIIHCMTRVRIKVHNDAKVNYDELKSINGVLGVVEDERIQVVVGPGIVNKVAKHMADQSGATLAEETTENQSYKSQAEKRAYEHKKQFQSQRKQSKWNKVLKSIANIFIPLIPAFIGAGLIGGIAAILSNLLTTGSISGQWIQQIVTVLNVIKDGMLFYLAIFTGEHLAAGQGGIIGVIFAVWLLSMVEKRLHKIIPNSIDIIVTPTITLLLIGLLTIFIIMPLAGFVSDGLVYVINWIIGVGGIFSGFIIGAFFLPLVMLGLHHIFTPIHIELINQTGSTYLLPIAAMAGAGQVGAAIALWVRCGKNKELRNTLKGALPVGFLGIGEPLIYGVTLPLGRPFFTACIGGGVGGAVIGGIGHIGATAVGPSGISLLPLIANNMYLGYIVGLLAAYAGGFIFTYFFGTTKEMRNPE